METESEHDAARRFGAAFPCEQSWSYFHVRNTPIQAHNMTEVAIHPIALSCREMTNWPITFLLEAMTMITAIKGAATTPLRIAAQNSALTGSICMKFRDSPMKVAAVIAA